MNKTRLPTEFKMKVVNFYEFLGIYMLFIFLSSLLVFIFDKKEIYNYLFCLGTTSIIIFVFLNLINKVLKSN